MLKQWSGSLDVPYMIPLAQEGSSSDRRGCPYSSRARRSNSSEALLDRSSLPDDAAPRNRMPPRGGPYKSSETLTDGKLRQIHLGSPEKDAGSSAEQAKMRLSMGGRGAGGGYNELLMDYIWGKQQRMQMQHHLFQSTGRIWQDASSPRSSTAAAPPHANGFSHSQVHLPSTAPPYSPMVLRGSQAELPRVKVTRTKSCGPFIPLQQHPQEAVLLSAYESPLPASGTTASSIPNLHPYQTELPGSSLSRRPPQFSLPTPEDSTRSLHKALALEGLRDWYLRNALGYPPAASKGHEAGISRLSHPHPLVHQAHSFQGEAANYRPQIPQSASFHGHPLHGRSVPFLTCVLSLLGSPTLRDFILFNIQLLLSFIIYCGYWLLLCLDLSIILRLLLSWFYLFIYLFAHSAFSQAVVKPFANNEALGCFLIKPIFSHWPMCNMDNNK